MSTEERLALLEKEIDELKQNAISSKENWIAKISGSFKNDPEFGEVLRLGRQIRKGERDEEDDGAA